MQKVVKFGGSSLADSNQFKKVKSIIESESIKKVYYDYIGITNSTNLICISILQIRQGRLINKKDFSFSQILEDSNNLDEIIQSTIREYYIMLNDEELPSKIILSDIFEEIETYKKWLSLRLNKEVNIIKATTKTDKEILSLAQKNANFNLEQQKLKELVNIHISMTSISDVSWMSEFQRLKIVRLIKSPISDLSVLNEHQNILMLELRDLDIRNIGFIENLPRILNLRLSGCPIEDYSPLLRMNSLDYLEIDEKAVNAIGMDNLIKHHPDAVIEIQQKINNRKV
jgi:hypothetical protein